MARSAALGPRQRARLLERVGPVVRAVAADERSQARNRQLALERLAERMAVGPEGRGPTAADPPDQGVQGAPAGGEAAPGEVKRGRRPGRDLDG